MDKQSIFSQLKETLGQSVSDNLKQKFTEQFEKGVQFGADKGADFTGFVSRADYESQQKILLKNREKIELLEKEIQFLKEKIENNASSGKL